MYIPVLDPVRLAVYRLLDVLVGKELQDKRDVVRVEEQLRHIFELQDICRQLVSVIRIIHKTSNLRDALNHFSISRMMPVAALAVISLALAASISSTDGSGAGGLLTPPFAPGTPPFTFPFGPRLGAPGCCCWEAPWAMMAVTFCRIALSRTITIDCKLGRASFYGKVVSQYPRTFTIGRSYVELLNGHQLPPNLMTQVLIWPEVHRFRGRRRLLLLPLSESLNLLPLILAQLVEEELIDIIVVVVIIILVWVPTTVKLDKRLPLLPELARRASHPHSLRKDVTRLENGRGDIAPFPPPADELRVGGGLTLSASAVAGSVERWVKEGEILIRLVVLFLPPLAAYCGRGRRGGCRSRDVDWLMKNGCASTLGIGRRREDTDIRATLQRLIRERREKRRVIGF